MLRYQEGINKEATEVYYLSAPGRETAILACQPVFRSTVNLDGSIRGGSSIMATYGSIKDRGLWEMLMDAESVVVVMMNKCITCGAF